ncbi:MAG: GNAT family N-acetyltransferase [Candidatus Bathyarchaeia archaeon]
MENIVERIRRHGEVIWLTLDLESGQTVSRVGLWERDVYIYGCKFRVGCIGGVWTKEEYRGRGYATRLLKSAIKRTWEDGGDILLVSGDRGLYRRLNCVAAAPYYLFKVSRADVENFPRGIVEPREYCDGDLSDLVEIYQMEQVRYFRTIEHFKGDMDKRHWWPLWPGWFYVKPNTYILRCKFQNLAYVVAQPSAQKDSKGKTVAICEYAGSRSAIVEAIPWFFRKYEIEKLLVWVSPFDLEFKYLLEKMGLKSEIEDLPGHTIKMLDFQRLCRRLQPYFKAHLGSRNMELLNFRQENNVFTVEFQSQRFQFDSKMIVRLVFGSVEEPLKISENGELAKMLKKIFPIPFPWPGLEAF